MEEEAEWKRGKYKAGMKNITLKKERSLKRGLAFTVTDYPLGWAELGHNENTVSETGLHSVR